MENHDLRTSTYAVLPGQPPVLGGHFGRGFTARVVPDDPEPLRHGDDGRQWVDHHDSDDRHRRFYDLIDHGWKRHDVRHHDLIDRAPRLSPPGTCSRDDYD